MAEATATEIDATTEIEKTAAELAPLVEKGSIKLDDLVRRLVPEPKSDRASTKLPLPTTIPEKARAALARLPEVFGRIVPTERRKLDPVEITALCEERETLDTVERLAKNRKEDLRTTVLNHFDVLAEEGGRVDDTTPRDKDGHYILGHDQSVDGMDFRFTFEVKEGSAGIVTDEMKWRMLAEDPDVPEFTHQDYLDVTDQVRVVNEHKVMLKLQKRPELVRLLPRVANRTSKTAAFWMRPRKS